MDSNRQILDSTEGVSAQVPTVSRTNSPPPSELMGRQDLADNWCYTQVKITRFNYMWTINNFSFCREEMGEVIKSSCFSAATNNNLKWCLRINPKGLDEESKDYLSLYLLLVHCGTKTEVKAKFKFSILNAKKEETKAMESQRAYRFVQGKDWGFKKFIRRDFLMDESNGLLPDDKLTIFCEVSVVGEMVNKSGQANVQAVKVPECHLNEDLGNLLDRQQLTDVTLCVYAPLTKFTSSSTPSSVAQQQPHLSTNNNQTSSSTALSNNYHHHHHHHHNLSMNHFQTTTTTSTCNNSSSNNTSNSNISTNNLCNEHDLICARLANTLQNNNNNSSTHNSTTTSSNQYNNSYSFRQHFQAISGRVSNNSNATGLSLHSHQLLSNHSSNLSSTNLNMECSSNNNNNATTTNQHHSFNCVNFSPVISNMEYQINNTQSNPNICTSSSSSSNNTASTGPTTSIFLSDLSMLGSNNINGGNTSGGVGGSGINQSQSECKVNLIKYYKNSPTDEPDDSISNNNCSDEVTNSTTGSTNNIKSHHHNNQGGNISSSALSNNNGSGGVGGGSGNSMILMMMNGGNGGGNNNNDTNNNNSNTIGSGSNNKMPHSSININEVGSVSRKFEETNNANTTTSSSSSSSSSTSTATTTNVNSNSNTPTMNNLVMIREFEAHKAILAARSPVFSAMFEHGMEETRQNRVDITDLDPETVAQVLRYIYTGQVLNLDIHALSLLVAADKYQLDRLKSMCEESLVDSLSVDNACDVLSYADIYNAEQLRANAMEFVLTHALEICDTVAFYSMASKRPHLLAECFHGLASQQAPPLGPARKRMRQG